MQYLNSQNNVTALPGSNSPDDTDHKNVSTRELIDRERLKKMERERAVAESLEVFVRDFSGYTDYRQK
ncbi:MAG: hypothetical protein AAF542_25335 [Pseudomonadota bacterium]